MTYDRCGNRTDQNQTTGNPPTNHISITAATNRITGDCYDASGNLLPESAPPCPSPTYTYDAENRMVNYLSAAYTYDGKGLRVNKASGSTTTVYIFSGSKVIAEYDNGAVVGSPSREYIYSGSALLAKIDSSAPSITTRTISPIALSPIPAATLSPSSATTLLANPGTTPPATNSFSLPTSVTPNPATTTPWLATT